MSMGLGIQSAHISPCKINVYHFNAIDLLPHIPSTLRECNLLDYHVMRFIRSKCKFSIIRMLCDCCYEISSNLSIWIGALFCWCWFLLLFWFGSLRKPRYSTNKMWMGILLWRICKHLNAIHMHFACYESWLDCLQSNLSGFTRLRLCACDGNEYNNINWNGSVTHGNHSRNPITRLAYRRCVFFNRSHWG